MRLTREEALARTREVVGSVIAPRAQLIDATAQWPAEGISALLKAGLGGLIVPENFGGLGLGLLGLAQVCEAIGRECASTALCFGMHCVGAAVISAKATEEQEELLAAISRGEHLTTLALSEPGTGAHFYYPQTRLLPADGDAYVVNGSKHFVTNGGEADSYVVSTVAADAAAPPNLFSCVVVQGDAEGLSWGGDWEGLGMRGNSSRSLVLDNVRVPRCALLGREGDQIWYVFNVVAPYFLMAMSGTYLGVASGAVEIARQHLVSRRHAHMGAPLSRNVILQHRMGELWGGVERTRRMIYHAAEEADAGSSRALPALCFGKADVANCAVHTVNEAMTLCGGIAYRSDDALGRMLRDARAAHVMAPTTDILLTWAGRALLDEPILGD